MQKDQLQSRLASLKKEFEAGQIRLGELDAQSAELRNTMLRITGAIEVIEELLGQSGPAT